MICNFDMEDIKLDTIVMLIIHSWFVFDIY